MSAATLMVSAHGSAWRRWLQRSPAWVALVGIVLLTVLVGLRPLPERVDDLAGPWHASWRGADGATYETDLLLPGLFSNQGLPSDARVLAWREVVAGQSSSALFLESPLYAVTVTWDGRPLGGSGDPSSASGSRSSHSLFLALPDEPPGTAHRLALDLRGDYGKGGVVGRILVGPTDTLHRLATIAEVQRLALGVGLTLLAALPLTVAARGAWRPTHLAFGLFASALATLALGQTDLCAEVFPEALTSLRLRRVADPLVAPLGVLFLDGFLRGIPSRQAWGFVAVGGAIAVLGAFGPPSGLYAAEIAGDALFVPGILIYAVLSVRGVAARLPGSWLLLGAVLPVAWAVGSEILLTHGFRAGNSHLLVAAIGFAVMLGAALVVRDAEVSEQHERLVRGSLDAMVTVDAEGRIENANPAARRMLDPFEEGAPFLLAVAEVDQPVVRAHLQRALTRSDRTEFRTPGGRVLESLATPLGPNVLMLTLRDITVRRELDRGMLQAARVETVGLLLGGIAHDFNNMLSALLAHLGMLKLKLGGTDHAGRLERMETAVDRASELTRRLLTIARGTGSELEATNVRAVVLEAAELAEPTLPENVKLEVDVPEELPLVLGAAGDLEQVIVNLLVNARDALAPTGGHVRLAARPLLTRGRTTGVVLAVEDDGPGIAEERRDEIFQPFVTDKPQGTGLGLAVARQILRDHHGRIWVEGRPGGGARFLIALRHADAVDEAPAPMPRGRKVLLVEDEEILLESYAAALAEAGYEPEAFSSSTEAARWLQGHAPDLLVTDVVMPGFHGVELARLCHQLHPEVPILFVSAFVPDPSAHALPEGIWSALHKPVRPARLVAMIGRMRRRKERQAHGEDDVTGVSFALPDLDEITAESVGL